MSVRVDVCESISRSHDGEIFSLPDLEINGMSRAQLCIREPQEAGMGAPGACILICVYEIY